MDITTLIIGYLLGALSGIIGAFLYFRTQCKGLKEGKKALQEQLDHAILAARESNARLQEQSTELVQSRHEKQSLAVTVAEQKIQIQNEKEKLQLLEQAEEKLSHTFKSLSSDALKGNNEEFLKLAEAKLKVQQQSAGHVLDKKEQAIGDLLKPMRERLESISKELTELEKSRTDSHSRLDEQLKELFATNRMLRDETQSLVSSLKNPGVRGRWGEVQLRRIVELAGMIPYCDFQEQVAVHGDETTLRPDMIINLPGHKNIIIDSKVPLIHFEESIGAESPTEKNEHLKRYTKSLRDHVRLLSKKNYHEQFDQAPEFVVLFLPGEVFFSAALQNDPSLLEEVLKQNVIIATPTTLMALLKAVAYGWQQEAMNENARKIGKEGQDLYKRISVLGGHFAKLGKQIESVNKTYNSVVGSLESNVLTSAKRLNDLGVDSSNKEIQELKQIELSPKTFSKPELTQPDN